MSPSGPATENRRDAGIGRATVLAVLVAALGYFVDLFDLVLFSIVRIPSLKALGVTDPAQLTAVGKHLLDVQLTGMLLGAFGLVSGVFVGTGAGMLFGAQMSDYLNIPYLRGAGELTVFCSALAGAALGFLWYNAHPAEVFMGDTGSLALGGAMGTIMILCKKELVLPIVGGIFFLESLSVILQTTYFKYTRKRYGEGRRIFRMAPLHHHFEQKGWAEPTIVFRFWIIAAILSMVGLATLKLR